MARPVRARARPAARLNPCYERDSEYRAELARVMRRLGPPPPPRRRTLSVQGRAMLGMLSFSWVCVLMLVSVFVVRLG